MDHQMTKKFIQRYKEHRCLWDYTSSDYSNKKKRLEALHDLVPLLGENGNVQAVRKKIDGLRHCYKREKRKKGTNEIYTPSLWYFDLMSFIPDGIADTLRNSSDDYMGTSSYQQRKFKFSKKSAEDRDRDVFSEDCQSVEAYAELEEPVFEDMLNHNEEENYDYQEEGSSIYVKRKKLEESNSEAQLIDIVKTLIESRDNDDGFARYLNCQLKTVNSDQRAIAEKLMAEVLYLARTDQLNQNTAIVSRKFEVFAEPTQNH